MKKISIGTQKRLLFIPYLNISILFIWLINCFGMKKSPSLVPKTLWILFSTALPLAILQILAVHCIRSLGETLAYINAYIIPLVIGYRLIRYQETLDL